MEKQTLIYNWNDHAKPNLPRRVELDDETLRDGLQSPSVAQPTIEQKLELLHLMDDLGVDIADIGLPGAGERVAEDVQRLAQEIVDCRMNIRPACAARTVVADIRPIVDVSQRVGIPIEVHAFIGSSPIRQYIEDWDIDRMISCSREALLFAATHDCPTMYVTEDTTRSDPGTLHTLLSNAIECGAKRVCLCDTVGHSTPNGVRALVHFVRQEIIGSERDVEVDWHGHSDRGLSLANTLAAIEAGAQRVHGTGLGIGERSGNTPMDLLLVNLRLLGLIDRDLSMLRAYCEAVATYTGQTIPANYPVVGADAFRTGTGVHAAAIIKSIAKEDDRWLCDEVYSGVRAGDFGLQQIIEIGPMSGKSNVQYWLRARGLPLHPVLVERIFERAKHSPTVLSDNDVYKVIVEDFVSDQVAGQA